MHVSRRSQSALLGLLCSCAGFPPRTSPAVDTVSVSTSTCWFVAQYKTSSQGEAPTARAEIRKKAAEAGATHVVWGTAEGPLTASAYYCNTAPVAQSSPHGK